MPDAGLLAAVTEEIGLDPEDPKDVEVGALAVRAAGRVLAERLRADADATEAQNRAAGGVSFQMAVRVEARRETADSVARWCGAEPEGDGNGA